MRHNSLLFFKYVNFSASVYNIYVIHSLLGVRVLERRTLFPITVIEEIKVSIIGWTSSCQQCLVSVLVGCRKSPVLLE